MNTNRLSYTRRLKMIIIIFEQIIMINFMCLHIYITLLHFELFRNIKCPKRICRDNFTGKGGGLQFLGRL